KTQALLYSLANSTDSSSDFVPSGDANSSDSSANSTPSSFTRTLRKGCTGADVSAAQAQLQTLGYYAGSLDGVYGTGTMAAVTAFQKQNGLTADGLTGKQTWNKLFAADASGSGSGDASGGSTDSSGGSTDSPDSSAETYATLRSGSKGDAVTRLQQKLKELNYSVSVTGTYDSATVSAVKKFQSLNSLSSDGVAGALTQAKLYGGSAIAYDESKDSGTTAPEGDTGKADGPSASSVKLLHWYNEVKPSIRAGQTITIFDPATSLQWKLRLYSLGHHADSEPLTLTDTQIQYKVFGNTNTWTPKAVYVQLPSGTWTLATMHNVPHLSGSIKDNGFDGHLCVHFLRDMAECQQNDPNYGVTHQNAIRKKWQQMTGVTLDY
ncbi:MAG: peptidoglycan-binding protein, partial [Eubacteriales bacterium]|nr:peptidoglycan-binding protein [Eubacteriales bacterium]